MALWGKTSNAESRPKSLPMDSNSGYSREFVTANKKDGFFNLVWQVLQLVMITLLLIQKF